MRLRSAGFTLLEMMVVISIIGILVAIAIPGFGYLAASTKVKGASTELYLALIRTRSEAVKRNRSVAIVASADGWQAGWQIIADTSPTPPDGDFDVGAGDRLVIEQGELKRVSITSADDSIVFRPTGRVAGASPAFVVTSEDQDRKVDLKRCVFADLTGRPFVKSEGC